MQFLSKAGDAVLLNVFDLIAVNYFYHLPRLEGLQIKSGIPKEAPELTAEPPQQDVALTDKPQPGKEDATAESQQQAGNPGKKRKRSKQERERPEEWQQRQARQAEADERHAQARPALEQALQLLKQHLAALHRSSLPAGQPCQQPADDHACLRAATEPGSASLDGSLLAPKGPDLGLWGLSDAPLPAPDLDLLSLAHMKNTLHPAIRFPAPGPHDPGASAPLFDTLVAAPSQHLDEVAWAHETPVVLPAGSRFLISDIKELHSLIPGSSELGFHCILLDPPWENASARRGAKYPMLPSRNLKAIPMQRLMHQEGCLVAMWVTNRERHRRFVEQELLPFWGLHIVATWHWLKVTPAGEAVTPLDAPGRHPYEVLLLMQPDLQGSTSAGQRKVPERLTLMSVALQHSRKPQLASLLQHWLPERPRCLEMFARELNKGWTSWGNQVLHFQQLSQFTRQLA